MKLWCIGYSKVLAVLSLLFVLSFDVTSADLCKSATQDDLLEHVVRGAAPSNGTDAGKFNLIPGASTFVDCVSGCCDQEDCNAVFFTQGKCFTIVCNSDAACKPVDKHLESIMMTLRTVEETNPDASATPSTGLVGLSHNTDSSTTKTPVTASSTRTCELGLLDCGSNEKCVSSGPSEHRSKTGICVCEDGYTRDEETQECVIDSKAEETKTTAQPITTVPSSTSPKTTKATTTVKATTPKQIELVVSAGENKVLKYPEDSVTLNAFALPKPKTGETYSYHWSILQHPDGKDIGKQNGVDESSLELSQLIPGLYVLQVEVTGPNKGGSAVVNITVLPESKVNTGPVAVIKPSVLNIQEGTSGILDGSESSDDVKVEKYLWEVASGPLDGLKLENNDGEMLKLNNQLKHGTYTIRLTVVDAEGLKNSTMATVNIEQSVDYPPKANAGDDVVINLPDNEVFLYGNASSDDKGIASYEWISKSENTNADINGVHEPVLHLSHLREGDYTFELQVTDTAGQKGSAEVHVYVKASNNKPPIAAVVKNVTTAKPGTVAVLDGSPSSDEQGVATYLWTFVSGPNTPSITNADRKQANVDNLVIGDYVFKLTVTDAAGLRDSTTQTIKVREHENAPPVALAGSNRVVQLPLDVLKLDGSKSTDDSEIVSYKWVKSEDSPGAGSVLDNSDSKAIMYYTEIVPGNYTFTLTVQDKDGLSSSDSVAVTVKPDPEWLNVVEISLDASIGTFSEKHKENLITQLGLMLSSDQVVRETKINIKGIYPDFHSGKLVVLFDVHDFKSEEEFTTRNGTAVKEQLQSKLSKGQDLIGFTVAQIDTVVCQNECSGHGYCDQFTRKCVCELMWMPDYVQVSLTGESNCAWSVLYVVVTVLGSVLLLAFIIWMCLCCARRCKRAKNGRRKHTYQLLQDIEQMEKEEKLAKKQGQQGQRNNITARTNSIFLSETDMSTDDEDTLFMNGKTGDRSNLLKHPGDFVKANNLKNKLKT